MTLDSIPTALLTVIPDVSHYEAVQKPDKYIVWAEDSPSGSLRADNKVQEQAVSGTIDYYTKTEHDTNVEAIQTALNSINIAWKINSIQYEKDTGYIHYEWAFEVVLWHA
jgi:hypothetical protein